MFAKNTETTDTEYRKLCAKGCGFFAASQSLFCSQCREPEEKISQETKTVQNEPVGKTGLSKIVKKNCDKCNKFSAIPLVKCACGGAFCMKHRYSDEHNCDVDRLQDTQLKLRKGLSLVKPSQINTQ